MAVLRSALSRGQRSPGEQRPVAAAARRSLAGYRRAAAQGGSLVALGLLPLAALIFVAAGLFTTPLGHPALFDYHGDIWLAGQRILHGQNPYDVAQLTSRLGELRRGVAVDPNFALPVYPAPALVVLTPLAALPYGISAGIFFALSLAAAWASLWVVGVRDWRCYGAILLGYPLMHDLVLGNVTTFLMLGAALAWRYRDRTWPLAAAIAAVITLKLFLWPLLGWMVITGRVRAAAASLALAAAAMVGGWAVLGFEGMREYPHLLSLLSQVESRLAFSPFALLISYGVGQRAATAAALAACLALLGVAWRLRGRPGADRYAFSLAILAGLAASPIVWSHYFALLYLLIALRRPRFSPVWLAPALLWPVQDPAGSPAQIAVYLALATFVCLISVVDLNGIRRNREQLVLAG